jgi:hypothetical protein
VGVGRTRGSIRLDVGWQVDKETQARLSEETLAGLPPRGEEPLAAMAHIWGHR